MINKIYRYFFYDKKYLLRYMINEFKFLELNYNFNIFHKDISVWGGL